MEFLAVPDSLGHSLRDIQPLHPLDLRMNMGDVHHIRGVAKTDSLPRLGIYPVGLENLHDFQFTATTLSLRRFAAHTNHILSNIFFQPFGESWVPQTLHSGIEGPFISRKATPVFTDRKSVV